MRDGCGAEADFRGTLQEPRLSGIPLEGLVKSVIGQAKTIGINVVP